MDERYRVDILGDDNRWLTIEPSLRLESAQKRSAEINRNTGRSVRIISRLTGDIVKFIEAPAASVTRPAQSCPQEATPSGSWLINLSNGPHRRQVAISGVSHTEATWLADDLARHGVHPQWTVQEAPEAQATTDPARCPIGHSHVPNAETAEAIRDSFAGKGSAKFSTFSDFCGDEDASKSSTTEADLSRGTDATEGDHLALAEKIREVREHGERNASWKKENAVLRRMLSDRDARICELSNDAIADSQKIDQLGETVNDLTGQVERRTAERDRNASTRDHWRELYGQSREAVAELKAEVERLTGEADLARRNVELLRVGNDSLWDGWKRLSAEIERLKGEAIVDQPSTPSSPWISVKDRLPEQGEMVDVWVTPDTMPPYRITGYTWGRNELTTSKVAHWRPVPKGPDEGEAQAKPQASKPLATASASVASPDHLVIILDDPFVVVKLPKEGELSLAVLQGNGNVLQAPYVPPSPYRLGRKFIASLTPVEEHS